MAVRSYFILVFLYPIVLAALDPCEKSKTCDKCIRDNNKCVWCSKENFENARCISERLSNDTWCSISDIINPKMNINFSKDLNFSSKLGDVIQIKPQVIDINMRPGDTVNFNFTFKPAQNYPVDLYFLIDGSKSMKKIKENTFNKIEQIYSMMQKMTRNVYIGMGSFIDKNALPFTQLKNATMTYSFHNKLKLTDKIDDFKNTPFEFGENYDPQEGTLDALAQVAVCDNEIGWRNQSWKIVIVLTNQDYHVANDGRMAAIYQPFDGKCHMEKGFYKNELEMDYPSVGIINKLLAEKEIIVMFLVTQNNDQRYGFLQKSIRGSIRKMYKDNTIVQTIEKTYKKIIRLLKLKHSSDNEHLPISIEPNCNSNTESSGNCKVEQDKEKTFQGTIKLLRYFNSSYAEHIISFEGIKENLKLKINIINTCNCKSASKPCTDGRTWRCGICECNSDRADLCNSNDNSTCIDPNTNSLCSDRGLCIRGQCICKAGYYKAYCQCIKDNCLKDDRGNLCSNNGKCDCGHCECFPAWEGDVCQCPKETDCTDGNGKCNGRGYCSCGVCKCYDKSDWDARTTQSKYCKLSCPNNSCHSQQCLNLEQIALDYLYIKDYKLENVTITTENNLTAYNNSDFWSQCPTLRVDIGCYTNFIYRYSDDKYGIEIKIESDYDCAETYYRIGGSCLGAFIIIGLLTLIGWKYITDKRDRLEFERFKKNEGLNETEHENPTFLPPIKVTNNPGYRSTE